MRRKLSKAQQFNRKRLCNHQKINNDLKRQKVWEKKMNSSPVSSGVIFDDETPKNCNRLVLLGWVWSPHIRMISHPTLYFSSARVGKTSLVTRFLGGQFEDCYTPTIEDFHRKLYRIRGEVYQLDILDTSGNHPFPAMRRLSFLTGELISFIHLTFFYYYNLICFEI